MFRKLLYGFLALPLFALADVHVVEYGQGTSFNFVLYNTDGTLDVDEVDGGTEVSVSCNEGAETTATNDFVDEGNFYSIALTDAELACARTTVVVAATDTNVFFIETYGHPNAQNPCPNGDCVTWGTMQASTASTAVLASATAFADNFLNGAIIEIVEGSGLGQTRVCVIFTSSTDTCTVNEDWDTTVDTSSDYLVRHHKLGNLEIDASGYASANVKSIDADQVDAASLAADAGTEIAAALGALQIEDQGVTYDLSCAMATLLAYAAGDVSTVANVSTYQDPSATETRIVGTVSSGARGSITITCP